MADTTNFPGVKFNRSASSPSATSRCLSWVAEKFQLLLAQGVSGVSFSDIQQKEKKRLAMYWLSDGIRATHNQDGATILAIHTGKVLRLNTTGSLVFRRLQEGATESRIVEEISERFGLSLKVATEDVREFLKRLERLGSILNGLQETSSQEMSSDNLIPKHRNQRTGEE